MKISKMGTNFPVSSCLIVIEERKIKDYLTFPLSLQYNFFPKADTVMQLDDTLCGRNQKHLVFIVYYTKHTPSSQIVSSLYRISSLSR